MAETIEVSTGYEPRALQAEIHRNLQRFSVLVCHRRFGKTVLCINELLDRALRCQRPNPRYAYLAPTYKQAKRVAWDYVKQYTSPIPGTKPNEAELRVDLANGARLQLLGAEDYDSLRGVYLDGVVLDEYAQMPPKAWSEVIRPALADRAGWAIFIGTPKGKNSFWELYEHASQDGSWFAAMYRASETGILESDELENARLQMDEDEYEQEFECSFQAAILGAYYGKTIAQLERQGRIGRVPWEPSVEVHTAWDLGIGDSTAIWFVQQVGREVRIIDHYEASGVGLEHYVRELKDRPYIYGEHILPHDAEVRELSTGRSRLDTLRDLGLRNVRVLGSIKVDDGINAGRNLLWRCWFDEQATARGLEALRQYRREWDEKNQVFKPRPLHNWSSHSADAWRYLALGLPDITDHGDDETWDDPRDHIGRSDVTGY